MTRITSNGSTALAAPRRPEDIRNIVLVGPSGSGKSGILARILATDPLPTGSHDQDHEGERTERLHAYATNLDGLTLNVVDTPGTPDFVGQVRAGLRAADAVVFVVSAVDAIDGPTSLLWQECAVHSVPRMVVVTKLDLPRADFDETVAACRRAFGPVHPLIAPGSGGLHNLLEARDSALVEAIIEVSEDETLLDRYLGGEELDLASLRSDLHKAVGTGDFFPLVPVDFHSGEGVPEMLELAAEAFGSPVESWLPTVTGADAPEQLRCDTSGPLVAQIISTRTDHFVGRQSLVRVFSGTLRSDDVVSVAGESAHVGSIGMPGAGGLVPVKSAIAGSLVVLGKLPRGVAGDAICDKDARLFVEPWSLPIPLLPTAIRPQSQTGDEKFANALQSLAEQDPTVRVEQSREHQTVVWTVGPDHLAAVLDVLNAGVPVVAEEVKPDLRETFVRKVSGVGRHVKQSGGHGQYAVVEITVEPLERGAGFEFVDEVVGGAVPRNFIPAVERGLREQLDAGVLDGHPVVDVRVHLTGGKAHAVDSSDMAFQTAAGLALRAVANDQSVAILEPVDLVRISVDDEHLGAVLADLSSRRARVLGTDADEHEGRSVIEAHVPQAELGRYPIELRSLSHGTGTFTREAAHFDYRPRLR